MRRNFLDRLLGGTGSTLCRSGDSRLLGLDHVLIFFITVPTESSNPVNMPEVQAARAGDARRDEGGKVRDL